MLIIPPTMYRKRPAKPRAGQPPVPAEGPVLIDAEFDEDQTLTLQFDRDVTIAGFAAGSITLDAPVVSTFYTATAATLDGNDTVNVTVEASGPSVGEDNTTTATASTGIAAVGGGAWAGVSAFPVSK